MDLVVAVFAVAVLGWAVIEFLAVAGLLGAVTGEKMERCPRCRHFGLTEHGTMHPNGCPEHLSAHVHNMRGHFGLRLPHHPHLSH